MDEKLIYLDNAATSLPKPEAVIQAMMAFMREVGGNPGRSGHRLSIEAGGSSSKPGKKSQPFLASVIPPASFSGKTPPRPST